MKKIKLKELKSELEKNTSNSNKINEENDQS